MVEINSSLVLATRVNGAVVNSKYAELGVLLLFNKEF